MASFRSIILCFLLIALPFALAISCRNCGQYCGQCQYGYKYSQTCHFDVCAKAPGQYCNLIDSTDGLCAAGTVCLNNRCQFTPAVFRIYRNRI